MPILTVGLLSDTHIPHRLKRLPHTVLDTLAGVDLILHAGDVDEPAMLDSLRDIAPVHAVRGNFHPQDFSTGGAALPPTIELQLAGQRVVLVHGHRPGLVGFFLKSLDIVAQWLKLTHSGNMNRRIARHLAQLYPTADVIVFGHTHRAHIQWIGHTLLVNPGAVCPAPKAHATVARMRLGAERPEVKIIPLPAKPEPTQRRN